MIMLRIIKDSIMIIYIVVISHNHVVEFNQVMMMTSVESMLLFHDP